MIHPTADVKTKNIGEGTEVWQFCVILDGARIGKYCNINCHVFIENDVIIGDHVTIKSGVQLWDGLRVDDFVFIGPNATFTNDLRPRSQQHPKPNLQTRIKKGASIGANVTMLAGITIGQYAMIGAGSVVTRDIPDYTLWYGNPAACQGYVCSCGNKLDMNLKCRYCGNDLKSRLGDAFSETHNSSNSQRIDTMQCKKMDYLGKISPACTIYEDVQIGENVTICENSIIYSHVKIGDGTYVGPNCILGEPRYDFYTDPSGYTNPPLSIGKNSMIRSHSIIYAGSEIGDVFHTGHHVTIREHSKIGKNCSIGTYGDLQGDVVIGDYCRFHSSVTISKETTIGNFVFIFPNCILTNDPHPPSDTCIEGPIVEDYAVICAGSVLMPGIRIGKDALVGANSLVTKDVAPEKVVLGVPARPICSIGDIKCSKGQLEKPYPWRNHFTRGMPYGQ